MDAKNANVTAFKDKIKPTEVRKSNIVAAKAVADAVRTSLGPKGMDKMIQTGDGKVIITNDGATILKHMSVLHPAAKMLVELSASQDVEAGDGTTSVVVLAGSFLNAAEKLLQKGIHPTIIADSFAAASKKAIQILTDMAHPVELVDCESLQQAATTSLNSKVVSQYSSLLAPIAVNAVLKVIEKSTSTNVDLGDIRVLKKLGGTIDDTEMIEGLVLDQFMMKKQGAPTRIEKAKVAFIQFQLSAPKPDIENQIVVTDYQQMDRIFREERKYTLDMCKKIKKAGANVLVVQKSILRDAVSDLAASFLSTLGIMVIKDIERSDVDFFCKSTGCKPIADIDSMTEDRLGLADIVEEVQAHGSKYTRFYVPKAPVKTVSIIVRGANSLVLEEAERSLHDALCVIRCLVKNRALIAGGGAGEMQVSYELSEYAKTLSGLQAYCFQAYSEAMQIIPITLAENAGLNPIQIVTELRKRHAQGEKTSGINVRKGSITNIIEEQVVQPLLVSTSAINLATDKVRMLLKIDDIVSSR